MRVLVVDDSAAIRSRLVDLLQEVEGLTIQEADGADRALEQIEREGADLVILDIHMPGKSGLEVLPQLKASACRPVVVVLTSHPTEQHRRECIALGADHFFDKTRDFALVIDVIVRPTAVGRPSDA